jgi:serine/threonine protein kinase
MLQLHTGQRVGAYQITGFLGRGAFAQVHLAEHASGREVALKVGDVQGGGAFLPRFAEITFTREAGAISPDEAPAEALFLDPERGARAEVLDAHEVDELIENEAALLAQADGRGAPRLYELIRPEGRPVLVMERVQGVTLRERIRSLEGVKIAWLGRIAETLEGLVARGWTCHGDLKPENVMITEDERVYLIDPVPESCRADRVVTTPCYNPFLRWDAKGDVQSLGIMLYELLACSLPFERAPWPLAGVGAHVRSEDDRRLSMALYLSYPPLREVNALTPAALDELVHRALCDGRFGLAEYRAAIERFLLRG